jgi:ribosome-binding factor A
MHERNDRLISLLRELAAEFIRNEANVPPLITVMHADVSSDLGHSTIFVTVYPESEEEHALNFLKRKGSDFRGFVKEKANLKVIPFFDFKIDYGEKHRQQLDQIKLDS